MEITSVKETRENVYLCLEVLQILDIFVTTMSQIRVEG